MNEILQKQINNVADATEVMKSLAELDVLISNSEEEMKSYKAKLDDAKKLRDEVEQKLIIYALEEQEYDDEFILKTEYGKVSKRKSDKWIYDDEKKIIGQLKVLNPKLIRVKEEIDKVAFKKAYEVVNGEIYDSKSDEIIDGVHVEEVISYSVSTNTKDIV